MYQYILTNFEGLIYINIDICVGVGVVVDALGSLRFIPIFVPWVDMAVKSKGYPGGLVKSLGLLWRVLPW